MTHPLGWRPPGISGKIFYTTSDKQELRLCNQLKKPIHYYNKIKGIALQNLGSALPVYDEGKTYYVDKAELFNALGLDKTCSTEELSCALLWSMVETSLRKDGQVIDEYVPGIKEYLIGRYFSESGQEDAALPWLTAALDKQYPPAVEALLQSQNYGLVLTHPIIASLSEAKRFEIALEVAEKDQDKFFDWIDKFELNNEQRISLALKIAERSPHFVCTEIQRFSIDPQQIGELALSMVSLSPYGVGRNVQNFLLNNEQCFACALKIAEINPIVLGYNIENFSLDAQQMGEIAFKVIELSPKILLWNLNKFSLNDEQRFACALKITENEPGMLSDCIRHFSLNQEQIFQIALNAVGTSPITLCFEMGKLNLNVEQRYEIACKIAEKDPALMMKYILYFDLTQELKDALFERLNISTEQRAEPMAIHLARKNSEQIEAGILEEYKIQHCLSMAATSPNPYDTDKYKTKAVDYLLWSLFDKCAPIPGNEEIIVTGYVMGDGKGDWFNMLNTCKHLQKKFPLRTIRLIAAADEVHKGQLKAPKVNAVDLVYYRKSMPLLGAPSVPPEAFSSDAEILSKLKKAAAIVVGPIALKGLYDSVSDHIESKGIVLNEYDMVDANEKTRCDKKVVMGLNKDFSIGIFTRAMKDRYGWKDVENVRLREVLFWSSSPADEEIEAYLATHAMYLCYMGSESALNFFKDAAAFTQAHSPDKSVDICYPCKGSIEKIKLSLADLKLEAFGIGSVSLIYYENEERKEFKLQLSEQGKEMRIIDVGGLSGRDFRILTKVSAPLVGCTGDNSLSQALSYGKIPNYEMMEHKRHLMHSLMQIVEAEFSEFSALYQYLNRNKESISSPDLALEAEALGEMIRDHFSVNSMIKGMVNERILLHQDPFFKEKEQQLRDAYLDGRISIEELKNQLVEELMARNLL